jgi:hypothetical protein
MKTVQSVSGRFQKSFPPHRKNGGFAAGKKPNKRRQNNQTCLLCRMKANGKEDRAWNPVENVSRPEFSLSIERRRQSSWHYIKTAVCTLLFHQFRLFV